MGKIVYKIEDSPITGEYVANSYGRVSSAALAKRKEWQFAKDLRKYGITPEQFRSMFRAQDEKCACCGSASPQGRGWCVDHNHSTGKVRGILCGKCNLGIGQLGDNLEGVTNAYTYLLRTDK